MSLRSSVKSTLFGAMAVVLFAGCAPEGTEWGFWGEVKTFLGIDGNVDLAEGQTLRIDSGGVIKTLDPALGSDLSSRNMINALYDTLLQYDYTARPYALRPSMTEAMPEISPDGLTYTFKLRRDLYFTPDECFGSNSHEARRLTANDVVYTFRRIADSRTHSSVFWMFRQKVKGVDDFRATTGALEPDADAGSLPLEGFSAPDPYTVVITLTEPDAGFIYNFAIPYTAIVSQKAVEFYNGSLADHVVGSGPFILKEWVRDHRMVLIRNPDYREEFFNGERLPIASRIECLQIKQPFAAWLMFLKGELDYTSLDKDNLDLVSGGGRGLAPALAARGIKLLQSPLLEVRYIGFNFLDPMLGKNLKLRQAISRAYNIQRRIEHSNFQLLKANGAIPPGVLGYESDFVNPHGEYDLEEAHGLLAEAGYPAGINPETGEALVLRFDQNGSSSSHRQIGELMVSDMAKIGIKVVPELNNGPRFFAKLNQGEMQLFRLSWSGDYPDAENFLQLFYSKNIGNSNRVGFSDPQYDIMYEEMLRLPSSQREEAYRKMNRYLTEHAPWIFESYPVGFVLYHDWVKNLLSHDFSFGAWKYLGVDGTRRSNQKKSFSALDFDDLRE